MSSMVRIHLFPPLALCVYIVLFICHDYEPSKVDVLPAFGEPVWEGLARSALAKANPSLPTTCAMCLHSAFFWVNKLAFFTLYIYNRIGEINMQAIVGLNKEYHQEENYYFLYLDVLGIKELVANNSQEVVGSLKFLLSNEINKLKKDHRNLEYRILSDNFILAFKSPCRNFELLIKLARIATQISGYLMCTDGILFRGILKYGKLNLSTDFTINKDLVDAYRKENNVAKYPRILVDETITENELKSYQYGLKNLFFKDADGEYCVNSLIHELNFPSLLWKNLEGNIIANYIENKSDPKIVEKINWLNDYIQMFIRENNIKIN